MTDIWVFFPETISKVEKPVCALFTMLVKKWFMVNIKVLKHCENLLKVSNEMKKYAKSKIFKSH